MFRNVMVAAIAGVIGLLALLPVAAQNGPSASRDISPTTVAPGEVVTVTITATGYGSFGGVTETLPAGFDYGSSSLDDEQVKETGQDVRFTLQGDSSFTYTVTASDTPGSYSFSGQLRDSDRMNHEVGGDSRVTVEADTPSASRDISPATVGPGEEVTVTITSADYGSFGAVTETLPAGFDYGSSSLPESQVMETGQDVRFILQGDDDSSFWYTVTASDTPGSYSFSGQLRDSDRVNHDVGGASSVTVEASAPSARRGISPRTVAPGGRVTVTITATNYGSFGGVTETLPAGFDYGSSSLPESQVTETDQDVRFILQGDDDSSFTYNVTASNTPGSYSFSGQLRDSDKVNHNVGGASSVTVRRASPPGPTPNRAPTFPGSSTTRSIDENSAAGANVGAPVRATDRDGDPLTYALSGTDASSFTINSSSGQIMVGTGTMLDFEDKASYTVTVRATDPDGADDTISVMVEVTNVDEDGVVTLSMMQPVVGRAVTASLDDPDGGVTGTTWQWANSDPMAGTFAEIDGATSASYTPVEADVDMYLVAMAMYDDGHGMDKEAMMVTANAVVAASDDACLEPLGMLPRTVSGTWASDCESEAKSGSYARYYSFTLSAAEAGYVEINLTSGADPYLALRRGEGRDGTVVAYNDNVGSRNFNSAINMMLDAGTYTVEATTYFAGQTGDFTLSVRPLQETEVLGTLTGSVDRSNSRWTSDYMSTQQEGSYARSYTFTLTEATHVAINLTAPEDPYLFLLDSSGMVVHESDNITTRNLNSRIDETLQPGRYTIEATTYFPARTGTFHLSIGVIP